MDAATNLANFRIITNNPQVAEKYPTVSQFAPDPVEQVFIRCRDRIHQGCRLITHPLSGSVKPNESPYKSVLISRSGGELDFASLQLIEGAEAVLKKLPRKHINYTPRMQEDYQVIDLDLVDSAIHSLPADYHF